MALACRVALSVVAVVLLSVLPASGQIVSSDFMTGADGWRTNANGPAPVRWQTGMISQYDISDGYMAFKAPDKYTGDKLLAYDGVFSFEMMTSAPVYAPSMPRVRMTGVSQGDTLLLVNSVPSPLQPGTFYAYSVTMNETAGWSVIGENRAPTTQEFMDVLSGLTDFRIIGDTPAVSDELFALRNIRLDPKPDLDPDPDTEPEPEPSPLKVFILAGQSNMAGCDDVRNVDPMWNAVQSDVLMYWGNSALPGFGALQPGTSGATCANPAPQFYFGPELSFGSDAVTIYPEHNIVIIKFAVGGTALYDQWTAPTSEYPLGGPLWNQLRQTMAIALNELTLAGYQYEIEAFLWMQGESDGDKKFRGQAYAAKLTSFIASMRAFTGLPQMPFILGRVRDAGQPHIQMVRDAQVLVAGTVPNTYWFDTDDLGMLPDGIHYDEAGMIELGHRFADIVQALP